VREPQQAAKPVAVLAGSDCRKFEWVHIPYTLHTTLHVSTGLFSGASALAAEPLCARAAAGGQVRRRKRRTCNCREIEVGPDAGG